MHIPALRDEARLKTVSAGDNPLCSAYAGAPDHRNSPAQTKSAEAAELGFAPAGRVSRDEWFSGQETGLGPALASGSLGAVPDGGTVTAQQRKRKTRFGLQFHLEADTMLFEEWLTKKNDRDLKNRRYRA